jgi:hypothetical protein
MRFRFRAWAEAHSSEVGWFQNVMAVAKSQASMLPLRVLRSRAQRKLDASLALLLNLLGDRGLLGARNARIASSNFGMFGLCLERSA